jgi:hypothetical protein
MRSNTNSRVATKSVIAAIAFLGTVAAFAIGAQAGALLNGRVMAISVAHVPMPLVGNSQGSPVNTHIR